MHYRRLGKTGIKISEFSLGAWVTFGAQVDDQRSIELVRSAYEQGVNFSIMLMYTPEARRKWCWVKRSRTCRAKIW
jgi:Predicted oxidoreductases (related to aryl-alcohol dehydrogenases)